MRAERRRGVYGVFLVLRSDTFPEKRWISWSMEPLSSAPFCDLRGLVQGERQDLFLFFQIPIKS